MYGTKEFDEEEAKAILSQRPPQLESDDNRWQPISIQCSQESLHRYAIEVYVEV